MEINEKELEMGWGVTTKLLEFFATSDLNSRQIIAVVTVLLGAVLQSVSFKNRVRIYKLVDKYARKMRKIS